jgi:hypothetical protein
MYPVWGLTARMEIPMVLTKVELIASLQNEIRILTKIRYCRAILLDPQADAWPEFKGLQGGY